MQYQFTKCLHPRNIINKYTGEVVTVSCGKCIGCSLQKSDRNTTLCNVMESKYKYCLFVTLDYHPDSIPLAQPIYNKHIGGYELFNLCQRFKPLGEVIHTTFDNEYKSSNYMRMLTYKTNIKQFKSDKWLNTDTGLIPFAHIRDVQLFNKRLRKYLLNYSYEQIHFYAVSEYGPKHFRPHYHILYFYDEECTHEAIQHLVHKAWPYGCVNVSSSRGKTSSYVTGYVNSATCLPELFRGNIAPKSSHSKYFGTDAFRASKEKIYEHGYTGFNKFSFQINGKSVSVHPWRTLQNTIYPRVPSFHSLFPQELYNLYTLYPRLLKDFGKRTFTEYIIELHGDWIRRNDNNFPTKYVHIIYPLLKNIRIFENDSSIRNQLEIQRLQTVLYVSKHFHCFCCGEDDRLHYKRFRQIIDFYKDSDYENLKNMYQQQITYLETHDDLFALSFWYPNIFYEKFGNKYVTNQRLYEIFLSSIDYDVNMPLPEIRELPLFKQFREYVYNEYQFRIKHKIQNEQNLQFLKL